MSHGSMSGSMTADHDKMAKPKKKTASGSMTSGSMSGSMSGAKSSGSMTGSTNH